MTQEPSRARVPSSIRDLISGQRSDLVAMTSELIAASSENPPGTGFAAVVARITRFLDDLEIRYRVVDTSRHGPASCSGGPALRRLAEPA